MKNQTYTPNAEPSKRKNRGIPFLIPTILLIAIALFLIIDSNLPKSSGEYNTPTASLSDRSMLEDLLYVQLPDLLAGEGRGDWSLEEIEFNQDKTQALLLLEQPDGEKGETLAREPEIVLAIWNADANAWSLHLTSDEDFNDIFATSAFSESEIAARFIVGVDPKDTPKGVVYGGYYLPWEGGLTKRLTWSVGHSSCNPKYYCTYAFDFADGTMFDLMASKGGFVYHWRDTCVNGDSTCTNSITLEDRTTSPWTYQIYMHIAQNSIPSALKNKGVYVAQGQQIANVDDTGLSTGHHVHFMVIEKATLSSCVNYCFGKAVDITFRDVYINWDAGTRGGRPRLVDEASWYGGTGQRYYVSGNFLDEHRNYLPILIK